MSSSFALIAGVVVVALITVVLIVMLDQSADSSQAASDAVALEKSYGADDAPVVVVEYADFPSILVDGQLIQNGSNYQVLQAAVEATLRSP